jgi:Cu/Ag efflux pump CusA
MLKPLAIAIMGALCISVLLPLIATPGFIINWFRSVPRNWQMKSNRTMRDLKRVPLNNNKNQLSAERIICIFIPE